MGVDVPELDDREYEQLLEEAKKVIPATAESWTDMNPHDPGVTIVELLAWLTESYVYQLDQVTDHHREKYLRLVGERRRRPRSASVSLSLSPPGRGVEIPAGTRLEATDGEGTTRRFETDHDVVCTDAELAAVLTVDETGVTDNTEPNETEGMFFRAFGDTAQAGAAFCLGFDGDPFADTDRCSLSFSYHDADLPEPDGEVGDPETFVPSVEVVWEYCTDESRWDEDAAWERLGLLGDETDRFYEGGSVSLGRPPGYEPTAAGDRGVGPHEPGLVWLRCRIRTPGYEIPPQFDAIRTNVVTASHRTTDADVTLRRVDDDGVPALDGQRFAFPDAPVQSATIAIDGTTWTEVPDFDASGPDDRHYVLDPVAGEVRFGDGERGAVPSAEATVVASSVVYGGGDAGNVPASTAWNVADPEQELGEGLRCADVSMTPLGPATGGQDMESIEAAFRRVKRDRRVPYRGVTGDDYAAIARRTPGIRIARTAVAVDTDDGRPAVTVVIVPYAPADCSKPVPSEGFLAAVQRHLDARRLLTDRVTADAPPYVGLTIDVEARTRRTYAGVGQETAVRTAIEEYLDPLRGGEAGEGWPFGRGVSEAELADVLDGLEMVDQVQDVTVTAHGDATVAGDGTIRIGETSLFYVESISADLRIYERETGGARR